MKTLREAKIGETVTVAKLHGAGAVKRRIMDMGITKGVDVRSRSRCAAMSFRCARRMRKWSKFCSV